MGRAYVCPVCEKAIGNDPCIQYKGRYYHYACHEQKIQREELLDYICKLYGFKGPGPKIFRQIKKYLTDNPSWTHLGIQQALMYFYEVKHNSVEKANEGIGIVPYVYNEAQQYYAAQEARQKRVAEQLRNSLETTQQSVVINVDKSKKSKKEYNLDNL